MSLDLAPAPWGVSVCDDGTCMIVSPSSEEQLRRIKAKDFPIGIVRICIQETSYYMNKDAVLAHMEFIVLARNAFDVMMRRRWHAYPDYNGKWSVMGDIKEGQFDTGSKYDGSSCSNVFYRMQEFCSKYWHDPFTAIVECDTWYRENIEGVTQ